MKNIRLSFHRLCSISIMSLILLESNVAYSQDIRKDTIVNMKKLANEGNSKAQFHLGQCYSQGVGVTKDKDQAAKWYRKSADQGNMKAQYSLGICYHKGEGVPQDFKEATIWYRKAAAQGSLKAKSVLANYQKQLPKFEKLLPSERFFNKGAISVGHTYGFMTNKNLAQLKKLLLAALGDGWELEIAPPEAVKEMNEGRDEQMEEIGRLTHKDFKNYSIGITLMKSPETNKEELKGYTKMLSIVTVDNERARKLEEENKTK